MSDDITLEPGMVLSNRNNDLLLVVKQGGVLKGIWFTDEGDNFSSDGSWEEQKLIDFVEHGYLRIVGTLDAADIEQQYKNVSVNGIF